MRNPFKHKPIQQAVMGGERTQQESMRLLGMADTDRGGQFEQPYESTVGNVTGQWRYSPGKSQMWELAVRNPYGNKIVFGRARDGFMHGFNILREEEQLGHESGMELHEMNSEIQAWVRDTNFQSNFTTAVSYCFAEGWSVIVLHFDDVQVWSIERFSRPPKHGARITGFDVVRATYVNEEIGQPYDEEGLPTRPISITLHNAPGATQMNFMVHPKRCVFISPQSRRKTRAFTSGTSLIEPLYDTLISNSGMIRSMAEYLARHATDPTVWIWKLTNKDQIAKAVTAVGDITHRSTIHLTKEQIEKDGIFPINSTGAITSPGELMGTNIQSIIAGCEMPRPVLIGETAGVLSGSQVSERGYGSVIEGDHFTFEPYMRYILELQFEGLQNYHIRFNVQFKETEQSAAEIEKIKWETVTAKTAVMTINEIREELGLERYTKEGGDEIPGLKSPFGNEFGLGNPDGPRGGEPGSKPPKSDLREAVDKILEESHCDTRTMFKLTTAMDKLGM